MTTVLLLCVLLTAAPARASIEGSPHDLIPQGYDVVKSSPLEERCSRCHIAASPALKAFLPEVPPVLAAAYASSSLVCFSCHDGTTIVSPVVDASRTAFHHGSHGSDMTGHEELGSGTEDLPLLSGNRMGCVTCHDPHDNGHRPFLRAGLQELCLICHSKFAEFGRGKENRTGNHILGTDPVATPRAEVPLQIDRSCSVAFPEAYPLQQGRDRGAWHWDLGGHLSKGGTGAVGCTTCHAVHGDEEAAPVRKLLAIEPVNDVANLFCEGCHAGARADGMPAPPRPNPGGTTTGRTFHPADDDVSNGSGRSLETREPSGWLFGGGAPRRLLCTTCHAPHAAWAETPLLRPPQSAPDFCEECHEKIPENHHSVGLPAKTACASRLPVSPNGKVRELTCALCHRAHNAGLGHKREQDFVPLLRESLVNGALCEQCHPAGNPTCSEKTDYLATHFTGDPTLPETYGDDKPPLRLEAWPESGLPSVYGGEKGQEINCLSCHTFKKAAVVSGDAGKSRSLLARSGNPVEWTGGQETVYLCTGCHSVDPATGQVKGHSHPMMKADVVKSGMTVALPMTATPSGHLNCDSCHRPHEAATAGGRYILEAARGQNTDPLAIQPKVDYTLVCHACHSSGSY
ncbi:MAG: cytochrome c3 family protein [Candidatus Methylomirabilia bacterium]